MNEIYRNLPEALLPWYGENKRDLPWRKDKNPYHIWLSEIMLQQTRVEAVKGYYARFIDALPDIPALASADDELLHKLWEGLGYYSRVRNLKKAAERIMEDFGGEFPQDYDSVLGLPGIGVYTAGAICSIAYDQPTPAVDGNVLRVISRLTDDDTPIDRSSYRESVRTALAQVYPSDAGAFTQALMELGATVCGPNRKPDCEECPCAGFCKGRMNERVDTLPVKEPKRGRKIEEHTVFVLTSNGQYALEKRPDKGLLAGLWQFPNTKGKLSTEDAIAQIEQLGVHPKNILKQVERKHIFTHIEWKMRGIYLEVIPVDDQFTWLTAEQIRHDAALPTAFRQFFEETNN